MGKQNIEKYSKRYALLKAVVAFWHNNVFYRKIIILGRDNINPDDHNIFAPNHQNALMDALAVLFSHKGQPIFLARADLFKNKFIASLLYFLKMLPVYRIRDGYSTLKENDGIFLKTIDVLKNKNGLVILPEGNHAGFRRLRQLKKGICRIAFQAAEASDYKMNIKIIPVGLEFTHYYRYRQVLTVVYGKPLDVSEFYGRYRESPEIAFNELRQKLSLEMKRLIVHIESEEDYEALDELRSIINWKYADRIRYPKLFRDRMLIDKMNRLKISNPELYKRICSLAVDVKKNASELKLDYRNLSKKRNPLILMLAGLAGLFLCSPVFLFGGIFNLTFLEIPNLQGRKIKDPQFRSTIKFGLSLAIAFVFLPVYLIISLLVISPWWLALLVFLALPVCGLLAFYLYLAFGRIIGGLRIWNYKRTKNFEYSSLVEHHNLLKKLVASL